MDHGEKHGPGQGQRHQHAVDVHGMLVVGERTIYLSHLPMFTAPNHRFQVILEATLARDGQDPHAAYLADRQQSGATIYTFQPDEFDTTCLEPGHPQCITSFTGSLFRNHFERRGKQAILPGRTVNVARVVAFRRLPVEGARPERLEYLLFGAGQDLFLAHLITQAPDFDQVLSVRIVGEGPAEDALRQGLRVRTVSRRANVIAERLRGGERVAVEVEGLPGIQLETVAEIYVEEGELREPDDMTPTSEEIAAGMP